MQTTLENDTCTVLKVALVTGATALELLRDRYDRDNTALILIGMPGIEKWFSRYPQLYSRIGFAHEYRPLAQEELHFVLDRRWHKLGLTLDPDDFTDAQAVAAVARITRGNFRLIDRSPSSASP